MAAEKSYFVTSLECEADLESAEGSASVQAPTLDGMIAHLLLSQPCLAHGRGSGWVGHGRRSIIHQ